AYLTSSRTPGQYSNALALAAEGRYKIIYVAPERLAVDSFRDFALRAEISLVAVDEAHCVSQWGQDFRPSYLRIRDFLEGLPRRPVVGAFTATATREVREDILTELGLENARTVVTGFDRTNLFYEVRQERDKYAFVRRYAADRSEESGIIYCLARKTVEEVCGRLLQDGIPATRYHAGLSDEERRRNQDAFLYEERRVMVATNAFGMGIDKSNGRYDIHSNMPNDVATYYPRTGRAGRDGEESRCILLYAPQDVRINQFLFEQGAGNEALTEEQRALIHQRDLERLRQMTFYATAHACLRDFILRYFGEYGSGYCGKCSNCLTEFVDEDVTETARGLISCVEESGQRFGMSVIVDMARGAGSARLRQLGLEKLPSYGSLAQIPVYRVRQVLNELIAREYLHQTSGQYPIVRLTGKSHEALEERIVMKTVKQETQARAKKAARGNGGASTDVNFPLFEELRQKRRELAMQEHVPPYIIFSDRTLRDMAVRMPRSQEEFLEVHGVGVSKCEKYGEKFLEIVEKYQKNP
ncbi:MAG: RecQ family ATP-dependent DNA helicase, partial [Lachnospiraceae bacterium]|nr:RecQ family ATP-dependent DNA helicase [Lachnospiraceae bacterium]